MTKGKVLSPIGFYSIRSIVVVLARLSWKPWNAGRECSWEFQHLLFLLRESNCCDFCQSRVIAIQDKGGRGLPERHGRFSNSNFSTKPSILSEQFAPHVISRIRFASREVPIRSWNPCLTGTYSFFVVLKLYFCSSTCGVWQNIVDYRVLILTNLLLTLPSVNGINRTDRKHANMHANGLDC